MYINIREGYSKTSLSIKSQKLLEKLDVYSGDYRNYPNGVIYFEIKHEFKYYPEIFKDQKRIKLEQQMDLVLNYLLEAPSDIKGERERRYREQVVNCCQFRSTTCESLSIVNHCSKMG